MKAQAKISWSVHEKYRICEQQMTWRGCTLTQSHQIVWPVQESLVLMAYAISEYLKRRDVDEGSG